MFKSSLLNATGYYRTQQWVYILFTQCHRLLQNPAQHLNSLHTMPPVTIEPSIVYAKFPEAWPSGLKSSVQHLRLLQSPASFTRNVRRPGLWHKRAFKDFPHNTSGYYRTRHCLRGMCGGPASGTKELLKICRTTPPAATEPGIVYAECAEARPLAQKSF